MELSLTTSTIKHKVGLYFGILAYLYASVLTIQW